MVELPAHRRSLLPVGRRRRLPRHLSRPQFFVRARRSATSRNDSDWAASVNQFTLDRDAGGIIVSPIRRRCRDLASGWRLRATSCAATSGSATSLQSWSDPRSAAACAPILCRAMRAARHGAAGSKLLSNQNGCGAARQMDRISLPWRHRLRMGAEPAADEAAAAAMAAAVRPGSQASPPR